MPSMPVPELPAFTKADAEVVKAFGGEAALAVRRLADEMTVRHDDHHPVIRYAMAETAVFSIISYGPETHGELMHAARLVSLSMMQFDLAHEAALSTTTIAEKVRLASAAMGLERTICQSEKLLTQRQAARKAAQPPKPPTAEPACMADDRPRATVTQRPAAEQPHAAANGPAATVAPRQTPDPTTAPQRAPTAAPRAPIGAHPPASLQQQPQPRAAAATSGRTDPTALFDGLDLGDPPDGVSAAVLEELALAMARQNAARGVSPPPHHAPASGFGEAPRP
jgi:hypothetical protein